MNKNKFLLKYKKLEMIGSGSFGRVYKIQRKNDKKLFALKTIDFYGYNDIDKINSINEVKILLNLNHENIIKLIEYFYDKNYLLIVLEYLEGGDMLQMMKYMKKKKIYYPEGKILTYFYQILIGLKYIHEKNIIHRDIKLSNVFLSKDKSKIKIADFNISKMIDLTCGKTLIGTPYYSSPEIYKKQKYDYPTDIWSWGCWIYELCNYRPPFYGENNEKLKFSIIHNDINIWNSLYSKKLFNLIESCLNKDPKKRPKINEILQNPLFEKIKEEKEKSKIRKDKNFKITTSRKKLDNRFNNEKKEIYINKETKKVGLEQKLKRPQSQLKKIGFDQKLKRPKSQLKKNKNKTIEKNNKKQKNKNININNIKQSVPHLKKQVKNKIQIINDFKYLKNLNFNNNKKKINKSKSKNKIKIYKKKINLKLLKNKSNNNLFNKRKLEMNTKNKNYKPRPFTNIPKKKFKIKKRIYSPQIYFRNQKKFEKYVKK